MENISRSKIIKGGISTDERGKVGFVNDFNFQNIKRFYVVENSSLDIVRAFHGHLKEAKYVFVVSGSAFIATVKINHTINPDKNVEVNKFILSEKESNILYIPPSYANGFMSLEENTKVMFFSTASLEESKNDDFRFPHDYWGKEIWDNCKKI